MFQGSPAQNALQKHHKMPRKSHSNNIVSEFANCIHAAGQNSMPLTFVGLPELVNL